MLKKLKGVLNPPYFTFGHNDYDKIWKANAWGVHYKAKSFSIIEEGETYTVIAYYTTVKEGKYPIVEKSPYPSPKK